MVPEQAGNFSVSKKKRGLRRRTVVVAAPGRPRVLILRLGCGLFRRWRVLLHLGLGSSLCFLALLVDNGKLSIEKSTADLRGEPYTY